MDKTDSWNNKEWTQDKTSLLPMRMQPMHMGHLNFILNTAERFSKAVIMLAQKPIDEQNPFSSELRREWIERVKNRYNIDNIFASEKGTSNISNIEKQKENYIEIAGENNPIFVTGNPNVIKKCKNQYSFDYINSLDVEMKDLVGNINDIFIKMDSNARKVRAAIRDKTGIPENYIPDFIPVKELLDNWMKR